MAHEGQLPRYSTIGGGSYTAHQEMREASSTQENSRVSVANVNAEQNASKHQDEGESFHVGQSHAAENRITLPHPVCSSSSFDYAVPSSSRTVIGASACDESTVRDATGFSQREQCEDLNVVYGDVNHDQKPPRERRYKCQVCDKSFKKKRAISRDIGARILARSPIIASYVRSHSQKRATSQIICSHIKVRGPIVATCAINHLH
ncbi:uncharacterized protein LOC142774734 [Rhipicephalus microplus]|uniref:uncharacterized protein LOC142774734 n=1 Tax=Rhipicephalus microplus TaxID=6941 RepID=UPI003F6CF27E